jgi:tetratricopeptide (TPR) repeat protein
MTRGARHVKPRFLSLESGARGGHNQAMSSARRVLPVLVLVTVPVAVSLGLARRRDAAPAALPARDEAAYRANNVGVALLEQYRFADAVLALRKSVALDPKFATARINLGIGLFYLPDLAASKQEMEAAIGLAPAALQPHYILGLIARQENRLEDAQASLRKVLAADPRDVGANVNLSQVFLQQRKYDDAIPLLETAVAAEPYNVTAVYNLGVALTRIGRRDEGLKATTRFQELRESLYKTQMGTAYLDQGRYAEALATTGAEAGLVDRASPATAFREAAGAIPKPATVRPDAAPAAPSAARSRLVDEVKRAGLPSALTLADLDGDGQIDLLQTEAAGLRVLHNQGGRFTDTSKASGLSSVNALATVAGDYDGDGRVDVLVLEPFRPRLFKNDGKGGFTETTAAAKIEALPFLAVSAAFVDVDHDGDLDIVIVGFAEPGTDGAGPAPNRLLRNNGDGTFTDTTAAAKLDVPLGRGIAIVPTDFDERRDIDLLVVHLDTAPSLYKNVRDGSFKDVAAEVGLPTTGFRAVAVGDVNKDGFSDFFFGVENGPGVWALSDGRGRFETRPAPAETTGARAAQMFDYDRDGLLDLLVATPSGLRLLRNLGTEWADVTATALGAAAAGSDTVLGIADLDGDDAQDLVACGAGSARVIVNGASANRSIKIGLGGRVSNRGGVGVKLDLRAGALRQRIETSSTTPAVAPADVVFGLGARPSPDAVRILWTSGIVQTETEFKAPAAGKTGVAMAVTELDRKPSSCPYLYAWTGQRFEFVTDFLGGGEMGYWEAPGVRNVPDPTEYVRIRGDQLRAKDGRLDLRVTNELEEVLYLDQVKLLAVTHPQGVEVYPNEGMVDPPREFKLWAVRDLEPPTAAIDQDGSDALAKIARLDRTYPEGFRLGPIRGYAEDHALTLDLAGLPPDHTLLVLTAWTDYAFSSDNVAASQRGLKMKPPALQVLGAQGEWETVIEDMGIPVGRPQSMVLDLAGRWKGADRKVRIVTNMRVYWDQIRIGAKARVALTTTPLATLEARLSERGFSAQATPDGREPFGYEYASASWTSPWKLAPGRYTKTGDVRELLSAADDLFVVSKPGDDVALSFDARALPKLAQGMARTYLLFGDGFSKELDVNSASPDVVLPLPYHGMKEYPFRADQAPAAVRERQARKAEAFDTRLVARPLPPPELAE